MNDLDSISSGQTFNVSVDRPPTHASLASPRIVNYETGKAGAKARSLWRLEPLRIRWVEFLLSIPWLCVLLLFFFHFHYSPFVYPTCVFFLFISPPLPTNDLMLHCGISVFIFLRFPPSFSFLLCLSDPGQTHREAAFSASIALAVSKQIFATSAGFLILLS